MASLRSHNKVHLQRLTALMSSIDPSSMGAKSAVRSLNVVSETLEGAVLYEKNCEDESERNYWRTVVEQCKMLFQEMLDIIDIDSEEEMNASLEIRLASSLKRFAKVTYGSEGFSVETDGEELEYREVFKGLDVDSILG